MERSTGSFEIELIPHEFEIRALPAHQIGVRALLDDPAAVHDDDLVGVAHRAQAMRDDDDGAALHEVLEVVHDRALVLRVEG